MSVVCFLLRDLARASSRSTFLGRTVLSFSFVLFPPTRNAAAESLSLSLRVGTKRGSRVCAIDTLDERAQEPTIEREASSNQEDSEEEESEQEATSEKER